MDLCLARPLSFFVNCLYARRRYPLLVLEDNQRMAYQGMLDRCSDLNVFEIDIEEAQAPLKPNIRPPASEDWERKRKYFAYIPAKLV